MKFHPKEYVRRDDLKLELTSIGAVADKYINNINKVYRNAYVDLYTIMPDHIHLIVKMKAICTKHENRSRIIRYVGITINPCIATIHNRNDRFSVWRLEVKPPYSDWKSYARFTDLRFPCLNSQQY